MGKSLVLSYAVVCWKMVRIKVLLLSGVLVPLVEGQGLRCDTEADCAVDEYNPYCSKWGYCTWTPSFGDTGPGQSKGAVEDGTRGQCRDDKDRTPWAPSCSPLGYCRGGVQDGSFGSRTNPKPGGEPSDWIKANAKSGGARNEEYYGKIEDDNRRNHVEFRKKYPNLFPKVSLDRLESIEENHQEERMVPRVKDPGRKVGAVTNPAPPGVAHQVKGPEGETTITRQKLPKGKFLGRRGRITLIIHCLV